MSTITQTISAITPSDPRTMTRTEFSAAAPSTIVDIADMVAEVNTWATQANALAAGLNAIATGAALSIPLTFSTTTTDSDPGNGIVRLDNATQNAATTIRTDLIGNDGSTWTDVINLFDDSTSTIKGFIVLVDLADATKWLAFSVSAIASPSGYKNITVASVASSTANPFANGASLALKFTRNGDKGDTGAAGVGAVAQAVGFTVTAGTTPKTLTVALDADVSGTNTGDNATNTQYSGLAASKAEVAGSATQDFAAKKLTLGAGALIESEGAAVVAASSTNIWAGDGNTVHVTGDTGIVDFATAPQAGAWMKVIFDGIPVLTQSANLNLNAGGANIQVEAGDFALVYADTTTQMDVFVFKKSGATVFPTSSVRLNTANGYGSTNTKIRRFTTAVVNTGDAITYADSAANGGSFTINIAGRYAVSYNDQFTGTSHMGVTLNGTQLTTAIQSLTNVSEIVAVGTTNAAGQAACVGATVALAAGDIIRAQTDGGVTGAAVKMVEFTITRVG